MIFQPVKFSSRSAGFVFLGGLIFGSYSGDGGSIPVPPSTLFIATQGASGDSFSQSATGDTFTQAANDDDFTQGGGIA